MDNIALDKALETIRQSRYILIITHVNPDADTLSCALALSNFLKTLHIKHCIYNASKPLPSSLNFLNGFHAISSNFPRYFDCAICVDCGSQSRFGFEWSFDVPLINVDHHHSNSHFGSINIVNENACSTAEVLFDFFSYHTLTLNQDIATALYVGIYDDSNSFTAHRTHPDLFSKIVTLCSYNIDPANIASQLIQRDSLAKYRIIPKILDTLELVEEGKIAFIHVTPHWLKQTGATLKECDSALDMIYNIGVVQIALFFRLLDQHTLRLSLRSKGNIDAALLAGLFGGGGHHHAAGCTVEYQDFETVKNRILEQIKRSIIETET